MNRVRLGQNAFDRWILADAVDESTAWSGPRLNGIIKWFEFK
jgi:hypothetical protein